jgi:hypothetical protein
MLLSAIKMMDKRQSFLVENNMAPDQVEIGLQKDLIFLV